VVEGGWRMKIALVSRQLDLQPVPPMGLVYLATNIARRGVDEVRIYERYNHPDMATEISEYQPDLLGITAMSCEYGEAIQFTRNIRKTVSCPVVVGGVHISTLPESLSDVFAAGVMGEGEDTFSEIVEALRRDGEIGSVALSKIPSLCYRVDGNIQTTPQRPPIANLDELPFPDFTLVSKKFFTPEEIPATGEMGVKAYILSSRGCKYRCAFCSTSRYWGRVRLHSPEYVGKYIKHMVEVHGATYLWTLDDLFTVSPKRVREIREVLIRHGVFDKLHGAVCSVRANLVTDELCKELKQSKVAFVNFGFESGSERVLHSLKGGSVTVEQNKQAIALCEKYGIAVYGSLMYGSPGETIEDMRLTNDFIDFAIRHKARYIWSFVAQPYPATPFWDIALERGKVSNNMDWSRLGCHSPEDAMMLDNSVDRNAFAKVFRQGRAKLNRMKLRMMVNFVIKNPLMALRMILSNPARYVEQIVTWLVKQ
jgi:anaerobic magnesium-protoporphyrin IX monomethyl ester cyclase